MQCLKTQKMFLRRCRVLCIPVWACVCVFGILIILHHIITSFRIILHHTSYCIGGTRIEYEANLRQMLRQNENVLRHDVSFGKYGSIRLAIEGISFFTKHEKKGRCFFAEGSKTVCVQSFTHRKEIYYSNLHVPSIVPYIKYYKVLLQ
jgi:hypothetical protein